MTPELAPPLLTTTPHQREDVSALDRFNVHCCPTRRVFSGTGLELVTRQATFRYRYHSATNYNQSRSVALPLGRYNRFIANRDITGIERGGAAHCRLRNRWLKVKVRGSLTVNSSLGQQQPSTAAPEHKKTKKANLDYHVVESSGKIESCI
ncbi:uncharacterized protein TNCV_4416131 [Trichonephila clavipes]|uniref:Uncharacterized protein n=1 Tax=Trichonephila clavipes TaxID=2585209 RepID=A0A8X6S7Z6_TRICX|nr:uncharacterized protein TNCV_4416131 [Trichonephila clavipes]